VSVGSSRFLARSQDGDLKAIAHCLDVILRRERHFVDSAVLLKRCWMSNLKLHNTRLPTERGTSMLFWALLHINIVNLYALWENGKSGDGKKFHLLRLYELLNNLDQIRVSMFISNMHGYNDSNKYKFVYLKVGLFKWICNSINNFSQSGVLCNLNTIRNKYIGHSIDFENDIEIDILNLFEINDHTINVLRALNRIESGPFSRYSQVTARMRWESADHFWNVVEMDRSEYFKEPGWRFDVKRYPYYKKACPPSQSTRCRPT
jgi:hypothetical protein